LSGIAATVDGRGLNGESEQRQGNEEGARGHLGHTARNVPDAEALRKPFLERRPFLACANNELRP
jgi:hypothetical protein